MSNYKWNLSYLPKFYSQEIDTCMRSVRVIPRGMRRGVWRTRDTVCRKTYREIMPMQSCWRSGILGKSRKVKEFVGKVREFLTHQPITKTYYWSSNCLWFWLFSRLVIFQSATECLCLHLTSEQRNSVRSLAKGSVYQGGKKRWKLLSKVRELENFGVRDKQK